MIIALVLVCCAKPVQEGTLAILSGNSDKQVCCDRGAS